MKSTQWLRVVVTSLVSLSAIAGCGAAEEPGPSGPSGGEKVAPVNGPSGFVVLTGPDASAPPTPAPAKYAPCAVCHGPAGQGTAIAPESRHVPITFSSYVIRNGRNDAANMPTGMVPNPAVAPAPVGAQVLTDPEITEIATWLNTSAKPVTADGLYKDFCGNCHGKMGPTGGAVGVKLPVGLPVATVRSAVREGFANSTPGMRTSFMPAFDLTLLTDAELALITSFIGAK